MDTAQRCVLDLQSSAKGVLCVESCSLYVWIRPLFQTSRMFCSVSISNNKRVFSRVFVHCCSAVSVLLSLQGVFSQVFDLQASDFDNDDSYHREG